MIAAGRVTILRDAQDSFGRPYKHSDCSSQYPAHSTRRHLAAIILRGLNDAHIELQDDDVLVLAQKIVSKAEGGCAFAHVTPSPRALECTAVRQRRALCEVVLWTRAKSFVCRAG